jgi:hypothetical protein
MKSQTGTSFLQTLRRHKPMSKALPVLERVPTAERAMSAAARPGGQLGDYTDQ